MFPPCVYRQFLTADRPDRIGGVRRPLIEAIATSEGLKCLFGVFCSVLDAVADVMVIAVSVTSLRRHTECPSGQHARVSGSQSRHLACRHWRTH